MRQHVLLIDPQFRYFSTEWTISQSHRTAQIINYYLKIPDINDIVFMLVRLEIKAE